MMYSIDRFEGIYAVCEDDGGEMTDILREEIPEDAREGDIIVSDEYGHFTVDREETRRRREHILRLLGRCRHTDDTSISEDE